MLCIVLSSQTTSIFQLYPYPNFSHKFLQYYLLFCTRRYFFAAQPLLKCYKCFGSGQECRDEVVSKNISAQVFCELHEDRCYWAYQKVNSSLEAFVMGCHTKQYCEKLPRLGEEAVSSNLIECFDVSCCDSDYCNKLRYTGRYQSWLTVKFRL